MIHRKSDSLLQDSHQERKTVIMKCKTFKSYADFPVTLEKGKAEGEDGDTVKVDGSRMFRGRSPSRNIHVVQLKQLSNDGS